MNLKIVAITFVTLWLGWSALYGAELVVVQEKKQFQPAQLEIKKGDTVVFRNGDPVSHNIFSSTPGHSFNLGIHKPGSDKKHTFTKTGEVDIRCVIHPRMKLKVIVQN